MSKEIKNLYDDLNLKTIPKSILDKFFSTGHYKEYWGGKPFNTEYFNKSENLNFFYNYGQKKELIKLIRDKKLLSEENIFLTIEDLNNYFIEYGKGFKKGYYQFEKDLAPENTLFKNDDQQIIYKIFSKAIQDTSLKKPGLFALSYINHFQIEDLNELYKTEDLKFCSYLKFDEFYKRGIEAGFFYKAWSIILHNPILFESLFNKHFKPKKNEEPQLENKKESLIDYDNSKLTEKIIALNESGVLDFLKNIEPFNHSTNSLAQFLSLCLGEKTVSIQSYINPIINKKNDQSKSPYNTIKTVEKVKLKLIEIGLKIK
ncbi:hypothetical protein [Polaribacter sargassicola]|uniref:hypothetical protein n=1 Tax=Polaribacter sargassicola TaxID=2836891 RepID=UPI001F221280|nr:hypothetical protein [Polaribacter sp. DS7-9]MCG1035214.1 hypothetical protein [Polaribacter sp. DS7-9]